MDWDKINNIYLDDEQLKNCRLISSRDKLLELLPAGTCVELGCENGEFSQKILDINKPNKLVLVDNNQSHIFNVTSKFGDDSRLEIKQGNSFDVLKRYEDETFDWIFIDTDHTLETMVLELGVSDKKIKKGGYIAIHDYIFHDYIWGITSGNNEWDVVTYGVIEAVNTFLKENSNYEVTHFALEPHMYNTIVLRRN